MKVAQPVPGNMDEYIAGFPCEVQELLEKLRRTVRRASPGAEEAIKYRMPTFVLEGNLVFFAAFKKHIGFYGASPGTGALKAKLSAYAGPKGSLKFPLDQPLPLGLIRKVVQSRVKENLERAKARKKKR